MHPHRAPDAQHVGAQRQCSTRSIRMQCHGVVPNTHPTVGYYTLCSASWFIVLLYALLRSLTGQRVHLAIQSLCSVDFLVRFGALF